MGEMKNQEEVEIDLKEIMTLILQNAAVIILTAICVGIFLYTDTKAKVSTVYTSTTKMYILSRNSSTGSNSDFISSMIQDYQALVTSNDILLEVNRRLEEEGPYQVDASQISVTVEQDNKVVDLSVVDVNPIASMKIANTVREVMAQYMKSTMNIKLFDVVENAMVGTPSVIDKSKRNAVLGGFLVACFIMGIIVMRYLIDDSIKTPEEVEAKLGLYVLASIPINSKQSAAKEKRVLRRKKYSRQPAEIKEEVKVEQEEGKTEEKVEGEGEDHEEDRN